jgi:hypothetical protein
MHRLPNWQTRLSAYLSANRSTPFRYGLNDCCIFSCDCVQAMTGHDMGEWFRGKYSTRKGAMEAIKQRTGGAGVTAIARYTAESLGMPEVPVAHAQRGDMALIGKGTKAILGIVSLSGLDVMALNKTGIVRVAFEHVTVAWRVGS